MAAVTDQSEPTPDRSWVEPDSVRPKRTLGLRARACWIALGYAVVAGLWIYYSDRALGAFVDDPALLITLSVYKGWFFVAFTAVVLLLLMLHSFRAIEDGYTHLMQAEQRVRASQRELASIIDTAIDAMITVDEGGRIVLFNPAAERMFRRQASTVLGQPIDAFVAGATTPGSHASSEGIRPDGTRFPVEASVSVTNDAQARRTTCVLQDESESQARIREIGRLSRLYAALSAINQAIVRARSEQELFETVCRVLVEQGRLRMAWIGWHDADTNRLLPAASWGDTGHYLDNVEIFADERPEGRGPTGIAFREQRPYIANDTLADPASELWRRHIETQGFLACGAFPIRVDGVTRGTLSVYAKVTGFFREKELALLTRAAEDVSFALDNLANDRERRSAEMALRELNVTLEQKVRARTEELRDALERAESADRMKSAFLATMSHELRTPLNSIIGFTGLILQELAGPLNEEQAKQLRMVRGSAQHLLALINDVLDISKIESGQLQVRNEKFDLRACIDRAIASVAPQAEAKGLSLTAAVHDDVDSMVGDPRRVEQILLNLLSNAIKFTDRGRVTLNVESRATIASDSAEGLVPGVVMAVTDTGIGIRQSDLEGLFQPFRQLETGLNRQHEGTGLGLTICRRLAHLLGGDIRVRSEWSKGSTFEVALPVAMDAAS